MQPEDSAGGAEERSPCRKPDRPPFGGRFTRLLHPRQSAAAQSADVCPTSSSRRRARRSRSSASAAPSRSSRPKRSNDRRRRRPSVDDLFRRVPGVSLTQAGGPGQVQTVRIRGGDVRHTLVLIDGIRMNDPVSTGREFDFANLVLADIERIEVLRGPQSALYGSDAMGGVINIITRRGRGGAEGEPRGRRRQLQHQGGARRRLRRQRARRLLRRLRRARHRRLLRLRLPHPAPALSRAGRLREGRSRSPRRHRARRRQRHRRRARRIRRRQQLQPRRIRRRLSALPDTPSLATSRLHNGYGRLIADTFGGALRNTVTTFANRTEREFRDVTFGLFGSTQQTDFIGDRAGAEYQGDLSLGAFGLLHLRGRAPSARRRTASPRPWRRSRRRARVRSRPSRRPARPSPCTRCRSGSGCTCRSAGASTTSMTSIASPPGARRRPTKSRRPGRS